MNKLPSTGAMLFIGKMLLVHCLNAHGANAWEDTCETFANIYEDGKDLCNTIFGDAFEYTTNEDKAYTMWWFDDVNDNDATTAVLNGTVPTTCNLQYYHKEDPSPEGKEFTECHPYKDSSCCHEATVTTPAAINKAYGAGYEWDRCGALSQACERFFVQEACLYECDPNAGLYRKCNEAQVAAATDDETDACHMNTWEMYKMPIKASYCDAWYLACYGDKFCGGNDGNFFSCAANYSPKSSSSSNSSDEVMPVWAIVLLCIFGVLALVICGALAFTVKKEKDGKPIFNPLLIEANKEAEAPAVEEDTSY